MGRILFGGVAVYAVASFAASAQAPRTVWDGVYTDVQAERGRVSFSANCSSCHGVALGGGESKALRGDRFWSDYKETSLDYVLGQTSKNMPFSDDGSLAGSLPPQTYEDIVAHILKANGFPAGKQELTRESSVGVAIVRKEGPGELPAGATAHVVGCLARGEKSGWRIINGAGPVRVLAGRTLDLKRALGTREYPLLFVITRLDTFVGRRMSVIGKLVGEGGTGGIEVSTIAPVSEVCE